MPAGRSDHRYPAVVCAGELGLADPAVGLEDGDPRRVRVAGGTGAHPGLGQVDLDQRVVCTPSWRLAQLATVRDPVKPSPTLGVITHPDGRHPVNVLLYEPDRYTQMTPDSDKMKGPSGSFRPPGGPSLLDPDVPRV